jgi:hypothetical protein
MCPQQAYEFLNRPCGMTNGHYQLPWFFVWHTAYPAIDSQSVLNDITASY